jgi:hypothetical protein
MTVKYELGGIVKGAVWPNLILEIKKKKETNII